MYEQHDIGFTHYDLVHAVLEKVYMYVTKPPKINHVGTLIYVFEKNEIFNAT